MVQALEVMSSQDSMDFSLCRTSMAPTSRSWKRRLLLAVVPVLGLALVIAAVSLEVAVRQGDTRGQPRNANLAGEDDKVAVRQGDTRGQPRNANLAGEDDKAPMDGEAPMEASKNSTGSSDDSWSSDTSSTSSDDEDLTTEQIDAKKKAKKDAKAKRTEAFFQELSARWGTQAPMGANEDTSLDDEAKAEKEAKDKAEEEEVWKKLREAENKLGEKVIIVLTEVFDVKGDVVGSYVTRQNNDNDGDSEDLNAMKRLLIKAGSVLATLKEDHRLFFKAPNIEAAEELERLLEWLWGRPTRGRCVFEVCHSEAELPKIHQGTQPIAKHLSLMLPSTIFFEVTPDGSKPHARPVPSFSYDGRTILQSGACAPFRYRLPSLHGLFRYDFLRMDASQLRMVTFDFSELDRRQQNVLSKELLVDRLLNSGDYEGFGLLPGSWEKKDPEVVLIDYKKTPLLCRDLDFFGEELNVQAWKYRGHRYSETMASAVEVYGMVFQVIKFLSGKRDGVSSLFLDIRPETVLTATELKGLGLLDAGRLVGLGAGGSAAEPGHELLIGTRFFLTSMLVMEEMADEQEVAVKKPPDDWSPDFIDRMKKIYSPDGDFNLVKRMAKTKLKILFVGAERTIEANTDSLLEA